MTAAAPRPGAAALFLAAATAVAGLAAGCRSGAGGTAAGGAPGAATPSPVSPASPTPLPLSAQVGGLDLTLLDRQGRPVARVTASAGEVRPAAGGATGSAPGGGPAGIGAVGRLAGSTAVLYKNGKPAARMTADSVHADQGTQTVTGTGSVEVRSLARADAPAIRADRMNWRYTTGTIRGDGHVLITRAPDLRIPGTAFTADTQLRTFQLTGGGGGAATGTMGTLGTLGKTP